MKQRRAIKLRFILACIVSCLVVAGFAQSDPTFNAQVDNPVFAMSVQPDGRIVVGGQITSLDNVPRSHLGRLNSDGSLDNAFNPAASGDVFTSVVLTNG